AEYQQLKAIRQAQANAAAGEVHPDQLTSSLALLGDGTTHAYIGAHPTHIDTGHGIVPVVAWYNT
ncbi:MAG TPA: hypothetical protein VGS06_27160, partial [Streptosporangiaceae bacterium]|nr:hypothetical protein [Streptosporangiaceae bacterium]